jgi:DNA-binding response OmpR family regulator
VKHLKDIRILIVDDEERIRELIKEYISLEGYAADEAPDGTSARLLRVHELHDRRKHHCWQQP